MSIKLNIGGKIFETFKPIISKSGYFQNLLEDCLDSSEIIFVNRSSKLFDHVLAYLIDDLHPYPKKYAYELDFYLIKYDTDKLYDNNHEIKSEINKIKSEIQWLEGKFSHEIPRLIDEINRMTKQLNKITMEKNVSIPREHNMCIRNNCYHVHLPDHDVCINHRGCCSKNLYDEEYCDAGCAYSKTYCKFHADD